MVGAHQAHREVANLVCEDFMTDTILFLWTWTPYLLYGFLTNIGIAVFAMLIGATAGFFAERVCHGKMWLITGPIRWGITFLRNTPSLVLLFYLSVLAPNEISFGESGWTLTVPPWLKAGLALSASPMVLMYWNFESWRAQSASTSGIRRRELLGRILESFTITTLASSVSSLIGVSELIGRCNVIINASSNKYSFVVYSYACLYFCTFLYAVQRTVLKLGSRTAFFHH